MDPVVGDRGGAALSFHASADEVQPVPQPIDVDLEHLATELDAPALRAALSSTSFGVLPARGGAVTFASLAF